MDQRHKEIFDDNHTSLRGVGITDAEGEVRFATSSCEKG